MKIKNQVLSLAAGILTTALPFTSQAAVPMDGFYVNGQGGYVYAPSVTARGITTNYYSNFTSYDFAGGIGYKSGPLRYEGQFNYIRGRIENIRGNGLSFSSRGNTNVYSLMANMYFDFDMINLDVVPYLGAGIGWANLYSQRVNGTTRSDNTFAYQGMAGLRYAFDDNISVDLGYRYFATTTAPNTFGTRWQANLINLGLSYNFG